MRGAARVLLDAELSRQALPVNRVLSNGTSLPASFGNVRSAYDAAKYSGGASDVDVHAQAASNQRAVEQSRMAPGGSGDGRLEREPLAVRQTVVTRGAALRSRAEAKQAEFDSTAEVTHNPDGTVGTKRSLLAKSARQVDRDASGTADDAKKVVTDLLRNR
jgi:conjugal transfer mating pair stabilization protein TraG